jgi:hypothetical protein
MTGTASESAKENSPACWRHFYKELKYQGFHPRRIAVIINVNYY